MKSNAQKAKDQAPPPFDPVRDELEQAKLALKAIARFEGPPSWSNGEIVDHLQNLAARAMEPKRDNQYAPTPAGHKASNRGQAVAPVNQQPKGGQTDDTE